MFFLWILLVFAIIYIYWSVIRLSIGWCNCSQHLVGKVTVVTGSNIGIGFANAQNFAERGAKVILACRDEAKGMKARNDIIAVTGNDNVHFYKLDLSLFSSIKEFVKKFEQNENRLDILVNNAGNIDMPIEKNEDGLLPGMQVNYFGPFLLTNLLLPMLKKSAPSRIVNVASMAYRMGKVKLDNMNDGKDGFVGQMKIYAHAKLCTILTTQELARKLEGTGVTVNALCPGFVASNIVNKIRFSPLRLFWKLIAFFQAKSCYEGAQTQIYLSVSPEVKDTTGCFFTECKKYNLEDFAKDPAMAKKLWEVTERLVKL